MILFIYIIMIKKTDLIIIGSSGFFCGTVFKSAIYYIDILLNILAFPIFLFILVYFIWYYKVHNVLEKKLLISVFLYLGTTICISFYVFFSSLLLFLIVFLIYRTKTTKDTSNIDIDYYSFITLMNKNKEYFNLKILVFICVIYYILLYHILILGVNKLTPEFW